ncbi:uncharacterized protein METZ01_LOCUS209349, partial [marine metagenome]
TGWMRVSSRCCGRATAKEPAGWMLLP